MLLDMGHDLLPILIPTVAFAIPMVCIVGGIIIGVVRTVGRQRMMELMQRERIAAIERGVDPAKLPPLDIRSIDPSWQDPQHRAGTGLTLRTVQGILIGGVVTTMCGVGLLAFLMLVARDGDVWAVGLIPGFVGIALLISAWIVWPRGNGAGGPPKNSSGL